MKQIDLPKAIAAYVPSHVVCRALAGDPPRPGEAERIEAAVLFADVAGFTAMSERMVRALSDQAPHEGHRGSEELNHLLNETFDALMQPVIEYGGVVTRFSGDALTAYFERPPDVPPSAVVASALTCAHAMQRAMLPFLQAKVAGIEFPISVKIGLGYGSALRLTVGDDEHGLESVLAGVAVDLATLAEKHAKSSEVVAKQSAIELLDKPLSTGQAREGFVVVIDSAQDTHALSTMQPDLDHLDEMESNRLLSALVPYLPYEVYESLSLVGGDLPGDFRRVTSIFVGFEGIRYELPDVGQALQDYFRWAQDVVVRFEGRLNRVITGGESCVLHILFGAPGKHDDDLVRALRCVLALRNDPARPASITAQRIGIASGIVLARPIGSRLRREYTVIGDEINLSFRLMTAGTPNDILVDAYTRDRTAQQFVFETLHPLQLKGKQFPVKAYQLKAERETSTGLTARYLSSRWAIVGRDAELGRLVKAANQALGSQGNTIFITGRTGVGKTRLVEEVVRHWVSAGGNGYIGQSPSHGMHSPYSPWVDLWRVFFNFHEADDAAARWKVVESTIDQEAESMSQWAGVLGAVLGLPVPESSAIAALDAADRRRKLFDLALELVRARAAHQPLLLLFEDLHWADRPSLELIDHIAAHSDDAPILLCLCSRPRDDLDLQVLDSPHCTRVELEELSNEHSAQMIRAVLSQIDPSVGSSVPAPHVQAGQGLPPEFEREIYDKTQGNPLFVEELLNSLIESSVLEARAAGGYKVVGDLSQAQVPDTLQDLLMARIDRLEPPSRDLLQVASVIDRRFAYHTLRGIYPYRMADLEMRDRLEATIQVDLTRLDHPEPELAYLFKHAMTYEVAYNSLPFARRRELHDRVGDFLEIAYLDDLEQYYPVLARHYGQSERWDKTLVYALAAGAQAQELYANDEALKFYEQAEHCLERLPTETYWINALRLCLNRAKIYRLKGQYDLCEVDINQALELAQTHNDARAQAEAYNLLAEMRWWQGLKEDALKSALLAYNLAGRSHNDAEMLTALYTLSNTYRVLGQFDQAMAYFTQAYDLARQRNNQVMLGVILNAIGVTYITMERFDNALEPLQQALDLLEAVDLKHRIASCLTNIGMVQFHRGQPQAALEAYRRAVSVGLAGGWLIGVAYTYIEQAEVLSYLGEYTQALAACQHARKIFKQTNDTLGEAYVQLVHAGEICLALGLYDQARPALNSTLHTMREYNDKDQTTRLLLRLAECSLQENKLDETNDYLHQADETNQPSFPLWSLSTKVCLEGRLALKRGDLEQANNLAQEAIESVNTGGDPDALGQAWELLAQIALAYADHNKARLYFECALRAVQARGDFINRQVVLKQAGIFLSTDPDTSIAAQGHHWLKESEKMEKHLELEREQYLNNVEECEPE